MNEVFLIGKIITELEFKFIINSKKKKSIVNFNIQTLDKQKIMIKAFNGKADFVYQKLNKDNMVFIYGVIGNNSVELKSIIAI